MSQSKYAVVSNNQGLASNNVQRYVGTGRSLTDEINPAFGKDWLTTKYGTFPYSFTVFDLIKGAVHGGICYTLLAHKTPKKGKKELGYLAIKSFIFGAGIDQVEDYALHKAYNTTLCGGIASVPGVDPGYIEHGIFQAILLQGGISALTAVGIKMLADRRKR